jgi:hypothetical protein
MIGNKKIWLWSAIAFALGSAGGYLYSSRFCKVSLGSRVEKSMALNQILRKTFTHHEFLTSALIKSLIFNTPDQDAITNQLQQNDDELISILSAYFDKKFTSSFHEILQQSYSLIKQAVSSQNNQLPSELNKLITDLSQTISTINSSWSSDQITKFLTNYSNNLAQEIQALKNKNWVQAQKLFIYRLNDALQIADLFDQTIMQQFPEKF